MLTANRIKKEDGVQLINSGRNNCIVFLDMDGADLSSSLQC